MPKPRTAKRARSTIIRWARELGFMVKKDGTILHKDGSPVNAIPCLREGGFITPLQQKARRMAISNQPDWEAQHRHGQVVSWFIDQRQRTLKELIKVWRQMGKQEWEIKMMIDRAVESRVLNPK